MNLKSAHAREMQFLVRFLLISIIPHTHSSIVFIIKIFVFLQVNLVLGGNELWPLDRPDGMPVINSLEVMCGKDHMDVHLSFSHPFEGIVSSKGWFNAYIFFFK